MLRMTKLTDYGIVLLTHMAQPPTPRLFTAKDLAVDTQLTAPMVTKICKLLAGAGLLDTRRGAKGGYALARPPREITIAAIIECLEGPMAITECSLPAPEDHTCDREAFCTVRGHTQRINTVIWEALSAVTLADLLEPATPTFFSLGASPLPPRIAATPTLSQGIAR